MYKLLMSAYKEVLLLSRDIGGLAILFIMPLILIVTITLVQDSSFKALKDSKIPILFIDNDKGELSQTIRDNLNASDFFKIITKENEVYLTENDARSAVHKGKYQLAVIIPENLSLHLKQKVSQNVSKILSEFGVENDSIVKFEKTPNKEIRLYFDPTSQRSFKNAVKNNIDKMIAKIESQSIYKAFQTELSEEGVEDANLLQAQNFISFKEISSKEDTVELIPNSTQHNVPAWTLFAIFFIAVPLSINIVKEKNQGTFVRLRTTPVLYATILGGKIITYLLVCIIQFLLMLAIGIYILPKLGLPALEVGSSFWLSLLVATFAGLAAIGFSTLLGTLTTTQEQAAPFGATSVVILAAIGGVWVPVFMMPKFMQWLSNLSPMSWGLNAFYDVFLRKAGLLAVIPEIALLFLFFIITIGISIIYDQKKRAI